MGDDARLVFRAGGDRAVIVEHRDQRRNHARALRLPYTNDSHDRASELGLRHQSYNFV